MSEEVTDHVLLDLSGLSLDTPLEESALARALTRVLAVSEDGPVSVLRNGEVLGRSHDGD